MPPGANPPLLSTTDLPLNPTGVEAAQPLGLGTSGGRPLGLEAALYGALTSNPDLVTLRQGAAPSAEAVEVARRFPVELNPTLVLDIRPWNWQPITERGRTSYQQAQGFWYVSTRHPIELGHQTTHRYHIAKAAYDQQRWNVVQAELQALVQTYRLFQTAAYRREKLRVARELADFDERTLDELRDRLKAGQSMASDVTLAEIEVRAARQQVKAAQQDYARALTDLRNQIGIPATAGTAEPFGAFTLPRYIPPADDESLVRSALQSRPEIHAARAGVVGAKAAVDLAKANRIPTPVVGPQLEKDEIGVYYLGFTIITPLPVLNNGTPLVRQREAELRRTLVALHQAEQRTISQVKAALANWNQANELVQETEGLTEDLKPRVADLERLYRLGQADLAKLYQGRERLIQLENAELDAIWQATQAQSDLLLALGASNLLMNAAQGRSGGEGDGPEGDSPTQARPVPPPPPPPTAGPFRPPGSGAASDTPGGDNP